MKREEKNQRTRRRILDRALAEFADKGYGGSSVNAVCAGPDVSKGIIYHYFPSKDALYLACVEECFQQMVVYLRHALLDMKGSMAEQIEQYFSARMAFFQENPVYRPIFCEAVMSPPAHLAAEVAARREEFDTMTAAALERLLRPLSLRPWVTVEETVELFQYFQNYANAKAPAVSEGDRDGFALRDARCRKLLDILLYGVVSHPES